MNGEQRSDMLYNLHDTKKNGKLFYFWNILK